MTAQNAAIALGVLLAVASAVMALALYCLRRAVPVPPPVLAREKLCSEERLREIVADLRRSKRRIVWTNGCFDLLHAGHVLYLEQARRLGDVLIVGLNSDQSARLIKGPGHPAVPQQQRALVLAGLAAVDYVIIFEQPTPLHLIDAIRPEVYAKGGDYNLETMNQEERRLVESYDCQVVFVPKVEDISTTTLKDRIKNRAQEPQV